MKILFLSSLPINLASSRVRVGQYLPLLSTAGINYRIYSYNSRTRFTGLQVGRSEFIPQGKGRRLIVLFRTLLACRAFDVVFLQKVVPPIWFQNLLKIRNPRMIFDFDDALFTVPTDNNGISDLSSDYLEKLRNLLTSCTSVIAGNQYLADYARQYAKMVTVIPSSVDVNLFTPNTSKKKSSSLVIGWAGAGEQHIPHLSLLKPVLEELIKSHKFIFRLIGDLGSNRFKQTFPQTSYEIEYIDWVRFEELSEEIGQFDIGVMPLLDDSWTRGKCGYKALLYMSSGVPTICSPVGINREIIQDGVNGFSAHDFQDWLSKLKNLLESPSLRFEFARKGRETVIQKYSLEVCFQKLNDILHQSMAINA